MFPRKCQQQDFLQCPSTSTARLFMRGYERADAEGGGRAGSAGQLPHHRCSQLCSLEQATASQAQRTVCNGVWTPESPHIPHKCFYFLLLT